jgi:hypothetical protein
MLTFLRPDRSVTSLAYHYARYRAEEDFSSVAPFRLTASCLFGNVIVSEERISGSMPLRGGSIA